MKWIEDRLFHLVLLLQKEAIEVTLLHFGVLLGMQIIMKIEIVIIVA